MTEVARAYLELGEYSFDLVQVFFGVRPSHTHLRLPPSSEPVGAAG
jgi:hypothetical protein